MIEIPVTAITLPEDDYPDLIRKCAWNAVDKLLNVISKQMTPNELIIRPSDAHAQKWSQIACEYVENGHLLTEETMTQCYWLVWEAMKIEKMKAHYRKESEVIGKEG